MLFETYLQGKPFFMPWQKSSIPYDSLLGLSLTLNRSDAIPVYLTNYYKHENVLELVLQADNEIIVAINEHLGSGIQYISIPPNDIVVGGMVTVIDTPNDEHFIGSLQLSPLYIHYTEALDNTDNVMVNTDKVPLINTNIVLNSVVADVTFASSDTSEDLSTVFVTFNTNATPTITPTISNNYIRVFDGSPVAYNKDTGDYAGIFTLPQGFSVTKCNESFALITPYNYETCYTSPYMGDTLGAIDCAVSHSKEYPLPLDDCFDLYNNKYVLNPMRIDHLSTDDGINYLKLDPEHDN